MTVQELIDELMKVEDKSKLVTPYRSFDNSYYDIVRLHEGAAGDILIRMAGIT